MKIIQCIIPVYNAEKIIGLTLKSILKQSILDKIHFIFVNDGSTDNTRQVLEHFLLENNEIDAEIINKKNGGAGSARNVGLTSIKDKDSCYITFMDADDEIVNDYFEKLLNLIQCNNADIVVAGVQKVYADKKINIIPAKIGFFDLETVIELVALEKIYPSSYGKIYKGNIYKEVFFSEEISVNEDTIAFVNALLNSNYVFLSDWVGYYINRSDIPSIVRSINPEKMMVDIVIGNYLVYKCNFNKFEADFKKHLLILFNNITIQNYLTSIPRIHRSNPGTTNKLEEYEIKFKKEKLFHLYKPKAMKERIKKWVYIVFGKKIYSFLMGFIIRS